jgi:hypothetical protein
MAAEVQEDNSVILGISKLTSNSDNRVAIDGVFDRHAQDLANAVAKNTEATSLILTGELSDQSVKILAEALKKNKTLTKLDLSCCSITPEGAPCLADMLMSNRTITSLTLCEKNQVIEGQTILAITDEETLEQIKICLARNEAVSQSNRVLKNEEADEERVAELGGIPGLPPKISSEEMYSDHLPQIFKIPTGKRDPKTGEPLVLTALNWNVYGIGLSCGYPEHLAIEFREELNPKTYRGRMARIAQTILAKNTDIVCLQEAPQDTDNSELKAIYNIFLETIKNACYTLLKSEMGVMTLVKTSIFIPGEVEERKIDPRVNSQGESYLDKAHSFQFTLLDRTSVTVDNIHGNPSDEDAASFVDYLQKMHGSSDSCVTVSFGDFNHGVCVPGVGVQLGGLIPPIYSGRKTGYDATDAGFISTAKENRTVRYLRGKIFNPENGKPLSVAGYYKEQPNVHRTIVLIDLEPAADPTLERLKKLEIPVEKAYDIKTGETVYRLLLAKNFDFEKFLNTEGLEQESKPQDDTSDHLILPVNQVEKRLTQAAKNALANMDKPKPSSFLGGIGKTFFGGARRGQSAAAVPAPAPGRR